MMACKHAKNFDRKMSLVGEREKWEGQVTLAIREIGHKRMSGAYMTQNRTQWLVFFPRFWIYMIQKSDTVTCFLSEILDLYDSESDTMTLCLSENYPIGHSVMFSVRDFGLTWLKTGQSDLLYVREFGNPNPVTIKYVIMVTRGVSFISISSRAIRIMANRLVHFF